MKAKNAAIWSLLVLLMIVGCRSKPTIFLEGQPLPDPPRGYDPAAANPLPLSGENCCAFNLGNKDKIVFLSRSRSRHSHFQIYVFDLASKKERRLTFHDGSDQGPVFDAQRGLLYYASTTDNLKDDPTFLAKSLGKELSEPIAIGFHPLWTNSGFDLYSSKIDGSEIQRLTSKPEFEGELTLHPKDKFWVYTALNGKKTSLFKIREGQAAELVTGADESEGEAQFSPSGQDLIWVRYDKDYLSSQIWLKSPKRSPRPLTRGHGIKVSPHFSPDGKTILFSSNLDDEKNYELYSMNVDGSCLGRLTYSLGQDLLPFFSIDGKSIYFTSQRTGQFQIYIQDYRPPACP